MFTARYGLILIYNAVPLLKRIVAGLSPRGHGFHPGLVYVSLWVINVALRQGFVPVIMFSLVSIIPLVLRIHIHPHIALNRSDRQSLRTLQKSNIISKIWEY